MFDEIAKSAGLAGPQSAQVSSPGWYDQSKIQAAVAAQGAGADGRTVLSGNNLLSVLNSIKAPKYVADPNAGRSAAEKSLLTAYQPDYGGQAGGDNGYYESANGTSLKSWKGADGQTYFQDTYDNPYGNGEKDKVDVVYRIDPASGQAIPVADDGAGHKTNARYQGSAWVNNYRDLASVAAVVGSAGLAGAASAGALGGGAGTSGVVGANGAFLGEGAASGIGAWDSALAGASAGGAGAAGTGAAVSGGSGSAPAYGGVGTSGAGAGSDAVLTGYGGAGAGAGAGGAAGGAGGGLTSAGSGGFLDSVGSFLGSNQGLSALGSIGSSVLNSYFANKALGAQTDAANNANALQKYEYDTARNDWAPYRQLGYEGLQGYSNLLKDPSSITSNPGYQFQLGQGQQAVDRSAASKGGLYSGATLKALDRFGQGLASTSYDQALGRYGNAAQIGATGTQGTQQAGTNYANQASNNITGLGNAQAGNALYQGSTYGNALNQGISAYNDWKKYGNTGG